MDTYGTRIVLDVTGEDPAAHFELVLDEYGKLEAADPDLLDCAFAFSSRSAATAVVEVEQTVRGTSGEDAFRRAAAAVRAAIHAAGGSTPSWDEAPEPSVRYLLADGVEVEPLTV